MKVTWLGQAGLLFEVKNKTILIDPYLSDSVAAINPQHTRRVPVEETFLDLTPDIIILTHDHADHTDMETLRHYLTGEGQVVVLASKNAWNHVRQLKGKHNYIMFNRHTEWTQDDITIKAVKAEHSDEFSIGIILEAEDKIYYITGDTLYNTDIFEDLPSKIDYVFLPVNGYGNNMNMIQAKKFCEKIDATAIPIHCGMFDDINGRDFEYEPKIVPEIYRAFDI